MDSGNQGRLITLSNFYESGIAGSRGLAGEGRESARGCHRYCATPAVYCVCTVQSVPAGGNPPQSSLTSLHTCALGLIGVT